MRQITSFFRIFVFFLLLAIPSGGIAWICFGRPGLFISIAFNLSLVLVLAMKSEDWCSQLLKCVEAPVGLARTAQLTYLTKRIEIRVFPEAGSEAIVVRSWFSDGSVLLSQGLIARLKEDELQALLKYCETMLADPIITSTTFFGFLSGMVVRMSPRAWTELFLEEKPSRLPATRKLGVGSALIFVFLFSCARKLLSWGGKAKRESAVAAPLDGAMQKLIRSVVFNPEYGLLRDSKITVVDRA